MQSKIFTTIFKKFKNFSNCELDKIGLSKHKYYLQLNFQNQEYYLVFPNRVFKLITSFSLKESIGGFVT